MSLRRKACFECVKAKRRCDRDSPACERCSKRSLTCEYYSPLSPYTDLTVDNTTNSLGVHSWDLSQEINTIANTENSMSDLLTCSVGSLMTFENNSFLPSPCNISAEIPGAFGNWQQSTEDTGSAWPMPRVGTESELLQPQSLQDDELYNTSPFPSSHDSTTMSVYPIYSSNSANQPSDTDYVPAVSRLRCIEQMWSRGQDTPRWKFCANEVLSFVHLFSRTGSAPFLVTRESSLDSITESTPVPLLRAMGVCAAYVTANESGRLAFEQLLEMEAKAVVESSNSEYFEFDPSQSQLDKLRAELVRVQVMTIYHIICLFSPSRRMRLLAESQEALVISWTRHLLLRLQALEKESELSPSCESSSASSSAFSASPVWRSVDGADMRPVSAFDNPARLYKEVTTSAYKTILMAHLVYTIYSSLKDQICRNLPELRSIPILTATVGEKTQHGGLIGPPLPSEMSGPGHHRPSRMTYIDYSDSWQEDELRYLDRRDRFTVLVLAACKGIGFLNNG